MDSAGVESIYPVLRITYHVLRTRERPVFGNRYSVFGQKGVRTLERSSMCDDRSHREDSGMSGNEDLWVGVIALGLGLLVLWAGLNSLRLSRTGDPRYGRITRGSGLLQIGGAPILIIVGLVRIVSALL
jgi:hypothetical protein